MARIQGGPFTQDRRTKKILDIRGGAERTIGQDIKKAKRWGDKLTTVRLSALFKGPGEGHGYGLHASVFRRREGIALSPRLAAMTKSGPAGERKKNWWAGTFTLCSFEATSRQKRSTNHSSFKNKLAGIFDDKERILGECERGQKQKEGKVMVVTDARAENLTDKFAPTLGK